MGTIGENIAALRKRKGMTQEALAMSVGVTAQAVSKWENNTNMPDVLLLPVIADIFGVSVDALYGRSNRKQSWDINDTFEECCEVLLDTMGASMYQGTTFNVPDLNDPIPRPNEEEYITRYKAGLKYVYEGKFRTGVMSKDSVVYYRHPIGGLLLRKPADNWVSLFEDEAADKVLRLIADRDFRTALAELIRSRKTVFTVASLCGKCGIENVDVLEEKFEQSGLFWIKKVDIDEKEVSIYELTNNQRMFLLFAILMCAKEFEEYKDMYYGCSGTGDYIYG